MLRNQEHRIKSAPGEANIGPRGAPQRFQKPGHQKDTLEYERGKQMTPKWEPQFEGLVYFRKCFFDVFHIIVLMMFQLIFQSFWDQV